MYLHRTKLEDYWRRKKTLQHSSLATHNSKEQYRARHIYVHHAEQSEGTTLGRLRLSSPRANIKELSRPWKYDIIRVTRAFAQLNIRSTNVSLPLFSATFLQMACNGRRAEADVCSASWARSALRFPRPDEMFLARLAIRERAHWPSSGPLMSREAAFSVVPQPPLPPCRLHVCICIAPDCVMKRKHDSLDHNEFRLRALKIAIDSRLLGARLPLSIRIKIQLSWRIKARHLRPSQRVRRLYIFLVCARVRVYILQLILISQIAFP